MQTQKAVEKKLSDVLKDERLHYPAANPAVNAPLALIQVALATERDTLKWVLEGTHQAAFVQAARILVGRAELVANAHEFATVGDERLASAVEHLREAISSMKSYL